MDAGGLSLELVPLSVGKRKQRERDVRRRPGGFLSEAGGRGGRGGGPGRKRPGGRGHPPLAQTDLRLSPASPPPPELCDLGKSTQPSLTVPQFPQIFPKTSGATALTCGELRGAAELLSEKHLRVPCAASRAELWLCHYQHWLSI